MEWIKTEDELPNRDEIYLVFDNKRGYLLAEYDDNGDFHEESRGFLLDNVFAWLDFPICDK